MSFSICMNISILTLFIFFINVNSLPTENDPCFNYCSNDGICKVNSGKPECYCLPEWEGERCDMVRTKSNEGSVQFGDITGKSLRNDPCLLVPTLCKNGGTCFVKDKKIECACRYEWYGTRCEKQSGCPGFCLNGATCTMKDDDEPECECEGTGYEGTRCQRATSTTTNEPPSTTTNAVCTMLPDGVCENGGKCVGIPGQLCDCPTGFTGDTCETAVTRPQGPLPTNPGPGPGPGPTNPGSGSTNPGPINPGPGGSADACASNPCLNGRPCYNNGNTFYCLCGSGYSGTNCGTING